MPRPFSMLRIWDYSALWHGVCTKCGPTYLPDPQWGGSSDSARPASAGVRRSDKTGCGSLRAFNTNGGDSMGRREQEDLARAERFPVHLPVRYRLPQSRDWFEARTENVSRTGLLFRSDCHLEPATMVDVRLEVSKINGHSDGAEVVCKCEVVRTEDACGGSISPAVAVAIHNYRFRRGRQPN
jgi:hypothetical protein